MILKDIVSEHIQYRKQASGFDFNLHGHDMKESGIEYTKIKYTNTKIQTKN